MLQYNVLHRQSDRPIGPVRTPAWIIAGAITGALALHGLVAAALFALAGPSSGAIDEAAITIFIDPGAPPVATATERAPAPQPEPPQPEAAAAPPQPALQESVPPPEPMESLAAPDFSQPPPPPPPPRVEPPKPPPPVQKVEPKRAAPAPAARVAPPAPAPGSAPAAAAPSAPSAGPPAAAPSVAPGWNALLAAWLAAHRRYPEDARKRSEEGDVTIRFTVASDGRVSDVAVVKGSGYGALDNSALSMLQGATLPAPGVEATRTVRIRFRLSD
jgi:periplasmic protein TonB